MSEKDEKPAMIYKRKNTPIAVMDYMSECLKCGANQNDGNDLTCITCKQGWKCPADGCDGNVFSHDSTAFFICHHCVKSYSDKFEVVKIQEKRYEQQ